MRYGADDKTATKVYLTDNSFGRMQKYLVKLYLVETKMILNGEESFNSLAKKFGLKHFTWKNRVLSTLKYLARYYNSENTGFAGDYKRRTKEWFELIHRFENNEPEVIIDERFLKDLTVNDLIGIIEKTLDKYYKK